MKVSVVIPSYNSGRTLAPCLRALHPQVKRLESWEVIVVDSSDDGTERAAGREFPWVRIVHLPRQTEPGRARNIGVEQSDGELVVFLDADCLPSPSWLERMLEGHDGTHSAVGGALGNANPGSLVGWASYLLEFSQWLPGGRPRPATNIPTANVSYKREVFRRHGLLPVDVFPAEDWLFNRRLVEGGESLLFDPRIRVDHVNRERLSAFLAHQRRFGSRSALAHARHDLQGSLLLRHPLLALLLPCFRSLTLAGRVARRAPRMLPVLLLVYPLIFCGLVTWSLSFRRSLADLRRGLTRKEVLG